MRARYGLSLTAGRAGAAVLVSSLILYGATTVNSRALADDGADEGTLAQEALTELAAVANVQSRSGRARIAQLGTRPGGQTYGRWAAEWWQWALGVPLATNPLFDQTGEQCDRRQVDDTWFLAGIAFFPGDEPGPVFRECTIPAGQALFFPLVNSFFAAFLDDPPEQRTEEFLRGIASCAVPVEATVEIDGFRIPKPERFSTGPDGSLSPLFNVQLPPGNVFGGGPEDIPELVLSPSAEEGVYLYVFPLSPGEHVVHWEATGCQPGNVQDVTYFLTVVDHLG